MLKTAVERAEETLIALLLAAMTLLTFIQVVLRYLFNAGLIWALEATGYMFVWLVLFGISYAVRVHAHIGIDVLVKTLPDAARRVVGLVAVGICTLYAAIMLYGGWVYFNLLFRRGTLAEDIPLPRWVFVAILPLGFLLFGIRLLQQAMAIYRGEAKGFELADEAAEALEEAGIHPHKTD
jgi:C4-dicarboxylate transporter DctQ subunit